MAPGSQATDGVPAGRSGGKILKTRRTTARNTPYDRPPPPQPQPQVLQPESPSWLTGLVFPAKFVAGGATKILSSFWNPKSWATPSSSSSDGDSESEDDSGGEENPCDEVIELNQQKGKSSDKSETLHLIEQLLMLEHYSREECDRLIEIINSRVVDCSMTNDVGPSMIHSRTNKEAPDIHNKAIMEAKKWVAEKKLKSGLKSDFDNGIHALKSAIKTPQNTEGEEGSPIDVARSYMRTRPPWASPINHDNSLSASPLAADLFKERTPFSSSGGGLSFSSPKRDYLSAGSWNIQDEIRRVRSKATEDMLSSHRPVKITSSTKIQHDTIKYSFVNDINDVGKDKQIALETPKSVEEIVNLAADGDMRTDQNELLPAHPIEQYQGVEKIDKLLSENEQNNEGNEVDNEKDDKHPEERNLDPENVEKSSNGVSELPEIPLVNNSQGSSSNTTENRAMTRASRQTRRGKAKGK